MLQNILSLEGVTVLGKKQQSVINGGQVCRFTMTLADGSTEISNIGGMPEGQAGSDLANSGCSHMVVSQNNNVTRCQYNCSWDD